MFIEPYIKIGIAPITATEVEEPGEWGEWSNWSACSATCGGGLRNRERECLSEIEGSSEEEYEEWKNNNVTFVCDGAPAAALQARVSSLKTRA